jgi:hypothetical protein
VIVAVIRMSDAACSVLIRVDPRAFESEAATEFAARISSMRRSSKCL